MGNSKNKLRIGIVGGGFGCSFMFHDHPNSMIEAVAELDPERRNHVRELFRCTKAYGSLEDMLKDKDIDAIALFSGAPAHAEHAIMSLNAGKHVFSAVPAATNLEDCEALREAVEKTGLRYMMAETSYYRQSCISARKFFEEGKFGEIFYTEAEYHHAGLDSLYFDKDGNRTWRYGLPPMLYPTHCTGLLVGVTRERMTEVSCLGWGDDSPYLKDNAYNNPFCCETALMKTDRNHMFRVSVFWEGAHRGCERAQWYGTKMSFFSTTANGQGPVIVRSANQTEMDSGGFVRNLPDFEEYQQPNWWETDMLPEPLRHDSPHGGSHTFLTHEFVDAVINDRRPAVDVYEALAMTVPGIVAHQSAMRGGEQLKVPNFDR